MTEDCGTNRNENEEPKNQLCENGDDLQSFLSGHRIIFDENVSNIIWEPTPSESDS